MFIWRNPYIYPIFKLYEVQNDLFGTKIGHLRLAQIEDLHVVQTLTWYSYSTVQYSSARTVFALLIQRHVN